MALASRQLWGNKKNSRPNFSKNNSNGSKGKQHVRTCYNHGTVSHFVAVCPYEQREDNGGKNIRKDKTKYFPNKNKFHKKVPHKVLVAQEEYPSDEDDDDEASGEAMGIAMLAIASSSSSKVSLFKAPNENRIDKCLMAKPSNKEKSKLKEHLEEGLMTCIQGENNLNDLLSSQKEVVAKEGVWFAPKSKKNKEKKTKQPP
ncbi:hypothetical protein ZWY2020_030574 [Hordeum vulgare]|nr:hypothetical protein ZWY2020_030574 [Hordeum vulgare]